MKIIYSEKIISPALHLLVSIESAEGRIVSGKSFLRFGVCLFPMGF